MSGFIVPLGARSLQRSQSVTLAASASTTFRLYAPSGQRWGISRIELSDRLSSDLLIGLKIGTRQPVIGGTPVALLALMMQDDRLSGPIVVPAGSFLEVTVANKDAANSASLNMLFEGFAGPTLAQYEAFLAARHGGVPVPYFVEAAHAVAASSALQDVEIETESKALTLVRLGLVLQNASALPEATTRIAVGDRTVFDALAVAAVAEGAGRATQLVPYYVDDADPLRVAVTNGTSNTGTLHLLGLCYEQATYQHLLFF